LIGSSERTTEFAGILAVSESSTLKGTIPEVQAIEAKARESATSFAWLNDEQGTKEAILNGMTNYSWIHLACHALQDHKDPTKSHFRLFGQEPLELSTIMEQSLPKAGLAFLSACQTATGDEKLPEEAVHLAAGMLSAGYGTVLATMWSIKDEDAPLVASEVYARLLGKAGETPDPRKAAWALHEAVAKLREEVGEKEFARWVPYIHMGH
jgi:CHAT domain-containing protein